ncbi:hypothetical protein K2P97_10180 [bacterium]|nr:hypothetical protein [bacterium]
MPSFLVKVMLQDVKNEEIYNELDQAMLNEDGYPYITDANEKMFALLPDVYEFEQDVTAAELLNAIKLACATIEKKHNLKKTPIMVTEIKDLQYTNLEELTDDDFQTLN